MQIIPMRELKNTVEIEKRCSKNEPVFITKNGYGSLVVMSVDYFEKTMRMACEAQLINEGLEDFKNGRVTDGEEVMKQLKEKYGI